MAASLALHQQQRAVLAGAARPRAFAPAKGLSSGLRAGSVRARAASVASETAVTPPARRDERGFALKEDGSYDLTAPPPFTLSDIREAIPKHCWEKNALRSMAYLALDVGVLAGLAFGAYTANQWWLWPAYWLSAGTIMWSLFVVGHDCGHQSFSNNRDLNDLVGNITHSSILVPYHGWRVSHRKHHGNHGHVENDESWHPVTKSRFEKMDWWTKLGRMSFPWSLFAYPFYLWKRSPGKTGSHYDPDCDLFVPSERRMVLTSDAFMVGMLGVLAACTAKLGVVAMFNLYLVPYWVFVAWLDAVTYLHHHGPEDAAVKMPWYRGEEWSYLRGGLTTLDRDYGIFNKIHHNIETHVVHHLFPQIPHYNLVDATNAAKEVMGPYYREPVKSAGPIPFHLVEPLKRSLTDDQFVADEGDIVFYQKA